MKFGLQMIQTGTTGSFHSVSSV